MNPLSVNDMVKISHMVGSISFVEISRRIGKDYFTVRKACQRIAAGLSCRIQWHHCTECDELISNPNCKTHRSCIRSKNARKGREKRKGAHVKSTKYVQQYRIDHPDKDQEQRDKYKKLLRSRWPGLPEDVKEGMLDKVHEADLRDQPLTVEEANNSGADWDADDDAVVIKRIKSPARDVALELGRTLYAVRNRRVHLRKMGLIY